MATGAPPRHAKRTTELGEQNAFAGLVSAFGGLGDFGRFLRRLEERAPDEIGDDMKIVADDFDSAIDESGGAAADLLGGDVSGLASIAFRQLTHANSYRRVDEFALANCGTQILGAAAR